MVCNGKSLFRWMTPILGNHHIWIYWMRTLQLHEVLGLWLCILSRVSPGAVIVLIFIVSVSFSLGLPLSLSLTLTVAIGCHWSTTSVSPLSPLFHDRDMGVSTNGGTPRMTVYNGKSHLMDDLGVSPFMEPPSAFSPLGQFITPW